MYAIRDARLSDAERLLDIYSYYVSKTAVSFEYETPSLDEFKRRIAKTLDRYPYLVVEDENGVEGYAYAGPFKERAAYDRSCETTVYLDRAVRGRGMGRALYTALENELRRRGILNMYACIACPEKEDEYLTKDSALFHEHLGFATVGTFHKCGYKFGRWYDMIWMEKIIGEHV